MNWRKKYWRNIREIRVFLIDDILKEKYLIYVKELIKEYYKYEIMVKVSLVWLDLFV